MSLKSSKTPAPVRTLTGSGMFLLLLVLLALVFAGSFLPGNVLFSNDGPLGRQMAECHRLPGRFTGAWGDLNVLGANEGCAIPNISFTLQWLLHPLWFSKLYAPLALVVLGLAAWCCFRQLGLTWAASALGALAAALNASFFSAACWGVASHTLTVAMAFLALAALASSGSRRRWLRLALAGFAVGMGVSEGADIGALFSLLVASFVLFQAWWAEGAAPKRLVSGLCRVALVAACAGFLAAQAVFGLITTQIQGVSGMQQDAQTKAERWDWATQWSLPKREALGMVIPGLFGYRMDASDGGNYWGAVGRAPALDRYLEAGRQGPPPTGYMRFSGGGFYLGLPVALLALWAALQAFRRKHSVFSRPERKWLGFWLVVGLVSLLLGFGRFAPLYRLVYALPYFSTIRNPIKFLYIFNLAVVVLCAYGVEGLWRKYLQPIPAGERPDWKKWWARADRFEKGWVIGCGAVLGVSLLGWLIYSSCQSALEQYLQTVSFEPNAAAAIAGFSVRQVGWFVLFLGLAGASLAWIFSGAFAGPRARRGVLLLGMLLVVDLVRANQPWIVYVDTGEKYASNFIIDKLKENPCQQRVGMLPLMPPPELVWLSKLYTIDWAQHQFPYYNIQSLDSVQERSVPADLAAFRDGLGLKTPTPMPGAVARYWQLTNTRYLLGPVLFGDILNQQFDPEQHRFRIVERFDVLPKAGILVPKTMDDFTVAPAAEGAYALFEFAGALPRATLYSRWQVNSNDQEVLEQLGNAAFNPEQSVFVAGAVAAPPVADAAAGGAGKVDIVSYAPKDIVLKAEAASASVLLLNDRFDPNWKVRVDGQTARLLRCNFIMRGVALAPGAHTVEFHFEPPLKMLYVSLAGLGVALLSVGLLAVGSPRREPASAQPTRSATSRE